MIARKQAEYIEISSATTDTEFTNRDSTPADSIYILGDAGLASYPAKDKDISSIPKTRKGSKVLEERLLVARKELEIRSRENNRLLEMARNQAGRLAAIESLPGLFLSKLEDVVNTLEDDGNYEVLTEQLEQEAGTPEILNKRFSQAITRLSSIFTRDHVLENKELRQTLVQLQASLAVKRDETLKLRVENEQLTQRVAALLESIKRSNVEVSSSEDRILKLQQHMRESEAKYQKLFVTSRSMKKNAGSGGFAFFANSKAKTPRSGGPLLLVAMIIINMLIGSALTLGGIWLVNQQESSINSSVSSTVYTHHQMPSNLVVIGNEVDKR